MKNQINKILKKQIENGVINLPSFFELNLFADELILADNSIIEKFEVFIAVMLALNKMCLENEWYEESELIKTLYTEQKLWYYNLVATANIGDTDYAQIWYNTSINFYEEQTEKIIKDNTK